MLLSLLPTVATPFSNNSCLLSSAFLHVNNYFYCFSSTPLISSKEFVLMGLGTGRSCTIRGAATGPVASTALPVPFSIHSALSPLSQIPSSGSKTLSCKFQFPRQENCLRQGTLSDPLHQLRELGRDCPIKKLNSFL